MSKYGFIIDTDSYSGSFERQMCAYLTGQVGVCEVGDEHVPGFKEQFPEEYKIFETIIGSEADLNGHYRPCEVYPTPGRFNHGSGTHYDDDDSVDMEAVKQDFIKKTDEYFLPLLAKAEANIAEGKTQWQNDAEGYKKRMQEARDNEINKWPAYESVKIHFCEAPSSELIEFMKQRAEDFSKNETIGWNEEHCKIKGFRLEENVTTTITLSV